MKYRDWITQHVQGDGYGQCAEVTQAMVIAFPELRQVRGHVFDALWGERAHWWEWKIEQHLADSFPENGWAKKHPTGFYTVTVNLHCPPVKPPKKKRRKKHA